MKLILKSMFEKSTIILCVSLLTVTVLLFTLVNLQRAYGKNVRTLKEKIEVVSGTKALLRETLKKTVRVKRNYKLSLSDEMKRNRALNDELAGLFSELSEKKSQIASMDSQLSGLRDESARLKGANEALKNNLAQLGDEKNLLAEKVAYLRKIQDDMQKKISRLLTRNKIELGEVIVKPAMLNGKVLKISKEHNFVIIDIGKNDGVRPDAILMAYREDKEIGEIKIEKVYDELSVGSAAFEWRDKELDIGDTVKGKV